jgi:exopolyphosphatase/guanosine-5'-triphosphate,3'-diphosphate pyrophosphatase
MAADLPSPDEVQAPFAHLEFNRVHTRSVARLALSLFDETAWLHGMGAAERRLLWYAALLHDVGQGIDYVGHHKHSMALILECHELALTPSDLQRVACLARYHRGADPKGSHPLYGTLPERDRGIICRLAAILRIADGLDRGQIGRVEDLRIARGDGRPITIWIYSAQKPALEIAAGTKKAALFVRVFHRPIRIEYAGPRP